MFLNSRKLFVVFFALIVHLYVGDAQRTDECSGEVAELHVLTKAEPRSLWWSLDCDDEGVVWSVLPGSLEHHQTESWIEDSSCISESSTCNFEVSVEN